MDKQKEQFCCHQTRFLDSKWPTNAFADGAPPYPAGKLTALPRLPSWIKGPLRGDGKGKGRREGERLTSAGGTRACRSAYRLYRQKTSGMF